MINAYIQYLNNCKSKNNVTPSGMLNMQVKLCH